MRSGRKGYLASNHGIPGRLSLEHPGAIGELQRLDHPGTMTPVYITAFNRLTPLKRMVEFLCRCPGVSPVVIDNASTYPPLLEWYLECPVEVIRRDDNAGPRVAWSHKDDSPFFAVTDSDLDLDGCPLDLVDVLIDGLESHPEYCKAGLSLEIDDLPQDHPFLERILSVELPYWERRVGRFFDALIGSTFAVYRSGVPCVYGPALRSDRPYTARHLPWYVKPGQENEEERYYYDHAQHASGLLWTMLTQKLLRGDT